MAFIHIRVPRLITPHRRSLQVCQVVCYMFPIVGDVGLYFISESVQVPGQNTVQQGIEYGAECMERRRSRALVGECCYLRYLCVFYDEQLILVINQYN